RLPLCQVATAHVTPVFYPACVAERIQLIEEMVKALVKDRAVRIVDPLRGRCDVKNRTSRIRLRAWRGGLNRVRRANQRLIHRFSARARGQEQDGKQRQVTRSEHEVMVSGNALCFKTAMSLEDSRSPPALG